MKIKYCFLINLVCVLLHVNQCLASTGFAVAAQDSTLAVLVERNAFELSIENGNLIGADSLIANAMESDIFYFGENHGISEIASLAQLLYDSLSSNSPQILVTEIGPYSSKEVESLVASGQYEAFMESGTNLLSVPFFFLKQEVPLLKSAVKQWEGTGIEGVWGLDQEFMAGAPIVFQYLEKLATTDQERKAVKKVRRKSIFNPFLIGMGSGDALTSLRASFENATSSEARDLTEQLVLSHKIYKEQMGGDARWSNKRREDLMMENLLRQVEDMDSVPNLFLKFGAYHLHRGASPTVKEALGLMVHKWALEQGMTTTALSVNALEGETLNPIFGTKEPLSGTARWKSSVFGQLVGDDPVLFDLRAIRNHPEVEGLSKRFQLMIQGYDFLILYPKGTAQDFLEGRLATKVYAIIIGVIVLLVLATLIFFLVRRIRRRRKSRKATA